MEIQKSVSEIAVQISAFAFFKLKDIPKDSDDYKMWSDIKNVCDSFTQSQKRVEGLSHLVIAHETNAKHKTACAENCEKHVDELETILVEKDKKIEEEQVRIRILENSLIQNPPASHFESHVLIVADAVGQGLSEALSLTPATIQSQLAKLQEKFEAIKYLQDIAKPEYEKMMNELEEARKEIERLKEWRHEVKPGEVCYYCQEPIQEYFGNPSKWPLYFCHSEEPGKTKAHHVGCEVKFVATLQALIKTAREALEPFAEVDGVLSCEEKIETPDRKGYIKNERNFMDEQIKAREALRLLREGEGK